MILGRTFTFIANPRTGSTSISRALSAHSYAVPLALLHVPPAQIVPAAPRWFACGIRNPFDRLVSAWAHDPSKESFSDWLRGAPAIFGGVDIKRTSQAYWASHQVQCLIRFERLHEDFAAFLEAVGLPAVILGQLRATDHPPYREVISQADRAIIEDRFAFDLSEWEYRF